MKRLHLISGAVRALGSAVQFGSFGFFAGIMLGVFGGGDSMDVALTFVLAVIGGLVGAGYGVARYLRFEYETAAGTFSMAGGVLNRQERDIPYGRIQNVDIRRSIVYRLLGLAVVKLETAGGGSTEAVLNAVSLTEARRIQDAIAGHQHDVERAAPDETEDSTSDRRPADEFDQRGSATDDSAQRNETDRMETQPSRGSVGPREEVLFELSTPDLAILSAVSFDPSGLALLIFSLPFGQEFAFEIFSTTVATLGGPILPSLESIPGLSTLQVGFVLFVGAVQFLLAAWLASAVVTAIKYYDFRLMRVGDDLRYERGMLGRYTGTIPLEKIQTVTVRENVTMRYFGLAALDVETAGYGPSKDGDASNTAIPLDERAVVVSLAEHLGGIDYPSVERPPKRARRRYAVRLSLLPVALALGLLVADGILWSFPRWWLPLVAIPIAAVAGHYAWKHRGHALTDGAFVARTSFWRRHTRIVPYYRTQTVIDSRSVFQRWRDLASVTADTASSATLLGGGATAHDVDEATAQSLHRTLRDRLGEDLLRRRARDGLAIGADLADWHRAENEDAAQTDPTEPTGADENRREDTD